MISNIFILKILLRVRDFQHTTKLCVEKFNQFLDEGIAYFSAIHDENLGLSENVRVLKRMKDIVHLILVESI